MAPANLVLDDIIILVVKFFFGLNLAVAQDGPRQGEADAFGTCCMRACARACTLVKDVRDVVRTQVAVAKNASLIARERACVLLPWLLLLLVLVLFRKWSSVQLREARAAQWNAMTLTSWKYACLWFRHVRFYDIFQAIRYARFCYACLWFRYARFCYSSPAMRHDRFCYTCLWSSSSLKRASRSLSGKFFIRKMFPTFLPLSHYQKCF